MISGPAALALRGEQRCSKAGAAFQMEWSNGKGSDALVGNIGGLKKPEAIALEELERSRRYIENLRRGKQWPGINRLRSVGLHAHWTGLAQPGVAGEEGNILLLTAKEAPTCSSVLSLVMPKM